jgi:hypothetical protein
MLRIGEAGVWIQEVVGHKHLIPSGDEVGVEIGRDDQFVVHSEEMDEGAV